MCVCSQRVTQRWVPFPFPASGPVSFLGDISPDLQLLRSRYCHWSSLGGGVTPVQNSIGVYPSQDRGTPRPGQDKPWAAVCLLRFPIGGLSCFCVLFLLCRQFCDSLHISLLLTKNSTNFPYVTTIMKNQFEHIPGDWRVKRSSNSWMVCQFHLSLRLILQNIGLLPQLLWILISPLHTLDINNFPDMAWHANMCQEYLTKYLDQLKCQGNVINS